LDAAATFRILAMIRSPSQPGQHAVVDSQELRHPIRDRLRGDDSARWHVGERDAGRGPHRDRARDAGIGAVEQLLDFSALGVIRFGGDGVTESVKLLGGPFKNDVLVVRSQIRSRRDDDVFDPHVDRCTHGIVLRARYTHGGTRTFGSILPGSTEVLRTSLKVRDGATAATGRAAPFDDHRRRALNLDVAATSSLFGPAGGASNRGTAPPIGGTNRGRLHHAAEKSPESPLSLHNVA
jgi:hypothetical protein